MINNLTTEQDDLFQLLEQSMYKSQKPSKPKQVITKPKLSFQTIYNKIKQMRIYKDAPVDTVGAGQLFSKNASEELQRFQILCSLMLSPQTKDEATAKCMTRLLELQIKDIADMELSDLKQLIYEVNFNTTKAERIKEMAQLVLMQGMPRTLEETVRIKGVGEKIGLLYMQIAFNKVFGIAVDVNMVRICNRLGICSEKSPKKLRLELEGLIDSSEWGNVNETLVGFGQQICLPNGREKCGQCLLRGECECEDMGRCRVRKWRFSEELPIRSQSKQNTPREYEKIKMMQYSFQHNDDPAYLVEIRQNQKLKRLIEKQKQESSHNPYQQIMENGFLRIKGNKKRPSFQLNTQKI